MWLSNLVRNAVKASGYNIAIQIFRGTTTTVCTSQHLMKYDGARNGSLECDIDGFERNQDGGWRNEPNGVVPRHLEPYHPLMVLKNTTLCIKSKQLGVSLGRGNRCLQQRMFMKKTSGIRNHVQHPVGAV